MLSQQAIDAAHPRESEDRRDFVVGEPLAAQPAREGRTQRGHPSRRKAHSSAGAFEYIARRPVGDRSPRCMLTVVVAGANVPDAKLLAATIEAVMLERLPVEEGWGACANHAEREQWAPG